MTAEPIDGIVKYQASHAMGDVETYLRTLPAGIRETALDALALFPELDAARTTLHDAGLIGVYPSGIGYGNISLRLAGNLFLISGSGTGSSRLLGKQGYSLVHAFDPLKNTVASFGPIQASSESMTHGAVYGAANKARCVIHIHSPFLFTSLLAKGFPRTPESVAYGTPALSREVARLITEELSPSEGVFVTAGHNEGVFTYGESIASTLNLILFPEHDKGLIMGIKIGIIGGSGLDNLNIFTNARDTFTGTVWGEPSSPLREGEIAGIPVAVLARHGRSHTIAPSSVNYRANIQTLKDAGCTHILATTATGSLREEIRRGDLVILDQFIDFTKQRKMTFHDYFKPGQPVHAPMAEPFDATLRQILIDGCRKNDFPFPSHRNRRHHRRPPLLHQGGIPYVSDVGG